MRRYLVLITVLLVAACGGSGQESSTTETSASTAAAPRTLPSSAEAKAAIEASPSWSDFQFSYAAWSFQMDRPIEHPTTLQLAKDLEAAGWMEVGSDGTIALTDKAQQDPRFLVRQNSTVDIVPMARKEVTDVKTIMANEDGTVRVEFGWRWLPNEVGASFKSGFIYDRYSAPQTSSATLQKAGEKWTADRFAVKE